MYTTEITIAYDMGTELSYGLWEHKNITKFMWAITDFILEEETLYVNFLSTSIPHKLNYQLRNISPKIPLGSKIVSQRYMLYLKPTFRSNLGTSGTTLVNPLCLHLLLLS